MPLMTRPTQASTQTLCQTLKLTPEMVQALNIDENSPFPLKVPQEFLNQIQPGQPDDPLLKQILPLQAEQLTTPGFTQDPVQDLAFTPLPGLIHKYHGRVLLIASQKCDIHCRYCFRRHFPYAEHSNIRHWNKALEYIAQTSSIHEVILSGGDPMSLAEQALVQLIQNIETIPHIKTLRIHSRTPVVTPKKSPTQHLINWAKQSHLNKVLVLHCNHPQELSQHTAQLFKRYRSAGFHLLNQSVLLKGINDDVSILASLSHTLFEQGVLPYYLHQLDRVQGSAHFEVPLSTAQQLHQQLRAQLPGYLLPQLVQDLHGYPYKIPL